MRRVSLVEESYDAVIRLGALEASDLLARRLGELRLGLYAAPGTPVGGRRALAESEFALVQGMPREVRARRRGRAVALPLTGRVRARPWLSAHRDPSRGASGGQRSSVRFQQPYGLKKKWSSSYRSQGRTRSTRRGCSAVGRNVSPALSLSEGFSART